ncbi:MAG: LysE family transporter [Candidatus Binatia bacterium]
MVEYMTAGVVLGLSAGLSPGPLLALVLSQALRFGAREGIKVALAPVLTDGPIILVSLVVLARLAQSPAVLGTLSVCGGLFVLSLAYRHLRTAGLALPAQRTGPRSLAKGVCVNALSPHPYLFWLTVGAPTAVQAAMRSRVLALVFVASFSSCLVGSKVCLAVLAGRSRHLLSDRTYRAAVRVLGLLLVLFAGVLIHDGYKSIAGCGG